MTPENGPTPEPPRFGHDAPPEEIPAPPPAGRGKRLAAIAAVVLVPSCALLAWQAIGYRQVRAQLDTAAAVFDAARLARAREVAPDSWQRAAEAMDAAVAELHRQEDRLLPFRSYPRVRALLTGAIAAATDAEAAAARAGTKRERPESDAAAEPTPGPSGPADARDLAREAIEAAKATLGRADAALARVANCPRAMHEIGIRRYVQNAGPTLEAMRTQIAGIETTLAKGDAFGATVAAESLKGKIDPIVRDLDGMATKVRCKKPQ